MNIVKSKMKLKTAEQRGIYWNIINSFATRGGLLVSFIPIRCTIGIRSTLNFYCTYVYRNLVSRIKIQAFIILLLMVVLSSCNHDKTHPGYAYMPDMYYSEAYNANSENPVFRNKITNQMPVPGTIARGHMPYPYQPKNYFDQIAAGNELVNPVEINLQTLSEGKAQYEIFCMSCHGEQGDGNGHLYTSKLYAMKPTSLIESYVLDKKDGEIFHVITVGSLSGLMGAHGSQIKVEDRWKIINYIRKDLAKK